MSGLRIKIEYQDIDIYYDTPPVPKKTEIEGYGLPNNKQLFNRWKFPNDKEFDELTSDKQIEIINYVLDKRENGHFFYNDGEITYITGIHWFYLTFWRLDVGLPDYRKSDRDYFYYWDVCVSDEKCYGMADMENRRGGKTERANCIVYEYISRTSEVHGGIQSKTDTDAKKVFLKLVRAWKRIPNWLKPLDEGDTQPKASLRFFEPSKRSIKGKKSYEVALDSWIDFESAKEEAYDGDKLHRYIMDEAGKTVNANVYERWNIVKECFVQGRYIIGKALITTTVEELDKKGGKWFHEIWKQSDPSERDDNGQTKSGLYRFFKPAFYCYEGFIDKHGNPLIEEAKAYLETRRNSKEGTSLASEKRKYPFTPDDAFGVIMGAYWEEDIVNIINLAAIESEKNVPIKYCKLFMYGDDVKELLCDRNDDAVKILEEPQEDVDYYVGIDGIGTDDTTSGDGGSRYAVCVVKGFGGMHENATSYIPVCTFSIRPNVLEAAYEVAACIIKKYNKFGRCKVLGETNMGGTNGLMYLQNKGLQQCMMKRPRNFDGSIQNLNKTKYWIYRDENIKTIQVGFANRFLRRFGSGIKISSLVKSLQLFGQGKNADECDAFLLAILGFFNNFDKPLNREKTKRKISLIVGWKDGKAVWEEREL